MLNKIYTLLLVTVDANDKLTLLVKRLSCTQIDTQFEKNRYVHQQSSIFV